MECTNGGLDWSHSHNSPFEITKLAVMDFMRTPHNIASFPLQINKSNPDGSISTHTMATVNNYKYLGVVFDPKLTWRPHITKVVATATHWTQQLCRIAKMAGALSPSKARQLYNMVAVPAFTYASDVWYAPLFKLAYSCNSHGSIGATKLFHPIQGHIAQYITGGLKGTAYNIFKTHMYIPPVDLLFRKVQASTATQICALPTNHPLHPIACSTVCCFTNHHKSPLHYLFHATHSDVIPIYRNHHDSLQTPQLQTIYVHKNQPVQRLSA